MKFQFLDFPDLVSGSYLFQVAVKCAIMLRHPFLNEEGSTFWH